MAVFLSVLMMFVSCSQYDRDFEQTQNISEKAKIFAKGDMESTLRTNLFSYVDDYLKSTTKLIALLEAQDDIDPLRVMEALKVSGATNYEEIEHTLRLNNVKQVDTFIELFNEMEADKDRFLEVNPSIRTISQEQIEEEISAYTLSKVHIGGGDPVGGGPCEDEYDSDMNSCHFNLALSAGASVALGIISGGIGGLFSGTMAMVVWTGCIGEAWDDMQNCLN